MNTRARLTMSLECGIQPENGQNLKKNMFFGSRFQTDGRIFSLPTPLSSSFHGAPKVSLLLKPISRDKKLFPFQETRNLIQETRILIQENRVPNLGYWEPHSEPNSYFNKEVPIK